MKKYILPLVTVLSLCIGWGIGFGFSDFANAQYFDVRNIRFTPSKVDQLMNYIGSAYVENIDVDSLTEEMMVDVINKLDPHSSYIPKKDIEIVNSELGSTFSGIGVQFSILNDTVNIVAVISGGPSEGAGIMAGDKIVSVDDSVFVGKGITNERVMHTLRGLKGTTVQLGIKRTGTADTLFFNVTRSDIPVYAVDASFLAAPKIGFVRVSKFGENTYSEFLTALSRLKRKGATSYIIDLRENSGGYMDQAIQMANEFLNSGDMIVYAEGRSYPRYEARANGKGRFNTVPLVVLIDDFSASASEIFAGAMQDNDRATIIGRRSFGKGLVQQQYAFSDGSALRLTIARYYTPSGRCIQKPYTMGHSDDYNKELINRFEHGEFYNQDSVTIADTTRYYTKRGRIVYGGGGIMPDIFVGRDTTLNTPYFNNVVNHAYTYQFAYQYTDRHRQELSAFGTWQELEVYLQTQNWLPEFVSFCEEKGVKPAPEQLRKSKPLLVRLVNSYVVRTILGDAGFFPLFERDDVMTKRAIEELSR